MSSGIELVVLFSLPWIIKGGMGVIASGGGATAGATAGGTAAAPVVSGAAPVAAAGAAPGTVASAGLTMAVGGAMLIGAGAAAFMAARYLHHEYHCAAEEYNARLEAERALHAASAQAHENASQAALSLAARTKIKAVADANAAFLLAGIDRLARRLNDFPDAGPQLPSACAQLRHSVEHRQHDFASQFAAYEQLSAAVATLSAQSRARPQAATSRTGHEALRQALQTELELARADLNATVFAASDAALQETLDRKLKEVEHLIRTQPHMAEQGLALLQKRLARELTLAARRQSEEQQRLLERASTLRELTGEISARSQAALKALGTSAEAAQYQADLQAYTELETWRARAEAHMRRLAQLIAGDLPDDLGPLRQLARESTELFEAIDRNLYEIAVQSYIQSQVAEVLTEMGYRVTALEGDSEAARHDGLIAAVNSQIGVQIQANGQGVLSSEMVALSEGASEVDEAAQERVCQLMDDVFDALRQRGHTLKEKKRRHSKPGRDKLRVVKTADAARDKLVGERPAVAAPLQRRLGE